MRTASISSVRCAASRKSPSSTQALIGSADARKLDEFAPSLQQVYPRPTPPAMLRRKDENTAIHGPVGLFEALIAAGRKGISLQRYKGLGEMNPEQLWETTLDTNARSLLQVRIKEVDEANVLFDQLMGDLVEPRRAIHPGQCADGERRRLTSTPSRLSCRSSRRPSRRSRPERVFPANSNHRSRRNCHSSRRARSRASTEGSRCNGFGSYGKSSGR